MRVGQSPDGDSRLGHDIVSHMPDVAPEGIDRFQAKASLERSMKVWSRACGMTLRVRLQISEYESRLRRIRMAMAGQPSRDEGQRL
jgi:hypothetical protein